MQLTMSMFATQADYWKARAELAEKTVAETAQELGCEPDNELMIQRANGLRMLAVAIESDPTEPDFRREYARNLVTPNDRVERPGAASGDRSARTTGCAANGTTENE